MWSSATVWNPRGGARLRIFERCVRARKKYVNNDVLSPMNRFATYTTFEPDRIWPCDTSGSNQNWYRYSSLDTLVDVHGWTWMVRFVMYMNSRKNIAAACVTVQIDLVRSVKDYTVVQRGALDKACQCELPKMRICLSFCSPSLLWMAHNTEYFNSWFIDIGVLSP